MRHWFCGSSTVALAFLIALVEPLQARIVINEIHYHPDPKTEPAEFVELFNSGPGTVNLAGWRLAGGISYVIPNGTSLAANQYLVIAQDPATILAKFSVSALGPWAGRLDNSEDTVTLLNASGGVEDEVQARDLVEQTKDLLDVRSVNDVNQSIFASALFERAHSDWCSKRWRYPISPGF